jgi:HlyD family secretion protein
VKWIDHHAGKRAAAIVAASGILSSCKPAEARREEPPAEPPIHAVGYLEPQGELRKLAFQRAGVITRVDHEVGSPVKAGTVLVQLDDRRERSQLMEAKAKLKLEESERDLALAGAHPDAIRAAEALCQATEVERDHREIERRRLEGLGDSGSVSEVDLAEAIFEARASAARAATAAAALAQLKNQVRPEDRNLLDSRVSAAQAEVVAAEALVGQASLAAPAEGTVVGIFLREGEAVSSSFNEPVILFAPAGPLEVRAELDEQFFSRIKVGNPAKIRCRDGSAAVAGRVREIKPVMGRKSVFSREATERMDLQIIEVRIELEDPPAWPFGLEVDVIVESGPSAVKVASSR